MLIGEIYLPVDRLMHYYGQERPGVHLPFNFQLMDPSSEARSLPKLIAGYEAALPAAVGRTGCLAITTGRASLPDMGRRRRASRNAAADASRHAHPLLR